MKKFFALALIALSIVSCQENPKPEDYIALDENQEIQKEKSKLLRDLDSLQSLILQLRAEKSQRTEIQPPQKGDTIYSFMSRGMALQIDLPLAQSSSLVVPEAVTQFESLSKQTGGDLKILVDASKIARSLKDIIRENGSDQLDLMIIMDVTASMKNDVENVKKGLNYILNQLSRYKGVRLAMATYMDKHDNPDWYRYQDFGNSVRDIKDFVNQISLTGNTSTAESVYDGVYRAINEGFFQSQRKRMVILIGHAPSHTGALSSHSLEEIIQIANAQSIKMNFYPILLAQDQGSYTMQSSRSDLINDLFPNPSRGEIRVKFEVNELHTIQVFNQNGQKLRDFQYDGDDLRLNLEDAANGVYVLRSNNQAGEYDEKKFIIQK
ncbi:T9SS type A sorting domain-containing protein [Croceimicrobium sp.]|uniref:T9SS type A sorting domain-containing protein n=1 Tax=Croceimicrobium sp. TaxID=2828340 RepID=UPI003BA84547